MRTYLSKNYKDLTSAGNKAKTDIENILAAHGFKNVGLPQAQLSNPVSGYFYTLGSVLTSAIKIRRGDVLVLQYPFKKYYTTVCNLAHLRGAKVVTVIHDLGSFRRKKLTVAGEIARLNHSDYIIAHNPTMRQWLLDNGIRCGVTELGVFDYLSETSMAEREVHHPYRVVYAGGLSARKNAFLYKLGKEVPARHYRFSLYGNGFNAEEAACEAIHYNGFMASEQLITTCDGDFGLVWDGDSTETCSGNFGQYLRYNDPHKTSLYIKCGLPIIIWDEAALAPFVREHGIGLCIHTLQELDERLAALTPEEYGEMKRRVCRLSEQVSTGYFVTEALNKAIAELQKV
jgi:hypothetical protein